MVTSAYGKVLIAVRDAECRTRFIGYRVERFKLVAFIVSACMAGVAGALYVPQVGIINPSEFAPANSIEAVIWVAVGGRGTLVGAALGAVVVNFAKTWFTGALPGDLAVRARRPVHRRHAVPAQGHRRHALGVEQVAANGRGFCRAECRQRSVAAPSLAATGAETHDRPQHRDSPRPCSISMAVSVSFDGFKALNNLSLVSARARCAPSSAPTAPARRP